jgi:hypothetical protein
MTKDTELPVLYRDVQKMITGMVPTPHPYRWRAARGTVKSHRPGRRYVHDMHACLAR